MPTQMLMMITVTRAQVALVQKGRFSPAPMTPMVCKSLFTAPSSLNMVRMIIRETNWGTAMVKDRMVRHRALHRVVGRSMIMAMMVPRKKFRKVAKKAHTIVQSRTPQNWRPMVLVLLNRSAKFFRPTQSKSTRCSPSLE